jgi:hypothetical protein
MKKEKKNCLIDPFFPLAPNYLSVRSFWNCAIVRHNIFKVRHAFGFIPPTEKSLKRRLIVGWEWGVE